MRYLALALLLAVATSAAAQGYPSKPIRIVVPWPAGGGTDVMARIVAEKLGTAMGQSVFVDNRAGASSMIGSEAVAKSAPDGYTLLWATTNHATNPGMFKKIPYDTVKDFTPILLVAHLPYVMVVFPGMPVTSVKELIALAKSKPGQISYASSGNGTMQHLSMELLKSAAGIDMVHVPYKGSTPAITDVLTGQVSPYFDSVPALIGHIKAGKMRPIAVSTAKRLSVLPDIPTIAESGIAGFDTAGFNCLVAPAGTPREIVLRLNEEVNRILKLPDVRERIVGLGAEPAGGTSEELRAFIQTQIPKFAKIIKDSGATVD